jgi:hypothetical protein
MKTFLPRACGALTLLLSAAVSAQHNYSYIEGGFLNLDYDRGDDSGLRLAASFDFAAPFALIGELADTGDFSHFTGGLLFHTPLENEIDFTAGVTLDHVDVGRNDDLGAGLRAGVRWLALTENQNPGRLEVGGELRHIFVFSDSLTSVRAQALFRVADDLDAQGALQFGDDDRIELGLRYYFSGSASGGDRAL